MRFDRESYRKLYIAESPEHQLLPLAVRGIRDYLLRFAGEDGTLLAETTDPVGDLMVVLRARPPEKKQVEQLMKELQRVGYLRLDRKRLWLPKFEEAQEARTPGAVRQKKLRDKRRNETEHDTETGDVTGDATSHTRIALPTADETRRDETTTPNPVAVVACPSDLKLAAGQRSTLETALIPGWAIDAITTAFIAKCQADPDDTRTLVTWRKCLSIAISGDWNNAAKRPKKPENGAAPMIWDSTAGKLVSA